MTDRTTWQCVDRGGVAGFIRHHNGKPTLALRHDQCWHALTISGDGTPMLWLNLGANLDNAKRRMTAGGFLGVELATMPERVRDFWAADLALLRETK